MLIDARNVVKAFGAFKAVDDASVSVEEGDILGLIGPNGAGKSTFFNCLTGVFGAKPLVALSGPNLLEISRLSVNGTLTNQFLIPVSNGRSAPNKVEQNACLVDPWGRRYSYYYKSTSNLAGWQATGYVLYSAGEKVAANGTQTASVNPTNGLLLATQTAEMLDNIYANPP